MLFSYSRGRFKLAWYSSVHPNSPVLVASTHPHILLLLLLLLLLLGRSFSYHSQFLRTPAATSYWLLSSSTHRLRRQQQLHTDRSSYWLLGSSAPTAPTAAAPHGSSIHSEKTVPVRSAVQFTRTQCAVQFTRPRKRTLRACDTFSRPHGLLLHGLLFQSTGTLSTVFEIRDSSAIQNVVIRRVPRGDRPAFDRGTCISN